MYIVDIDKCNEQFTNCNADIIARHRNEFKYPDHLKKMIQFWYDDCNIKIEKDIRTQSFNTLIFDSEEDFVYWYIKWS